jgi:1-deoxy-D-xylulose-5-phosphate synthase
MGVDLNTWTTVSALNIGDLKNIFQYAEHHKLKHSWALLERPNVLSVKYSNHLTRTADVPDLLKSIVATEQDNTVELQMFTAQQENQGAFTIRYPRGNGVLTDWKTPFEAIKVGTGRRLVNGSDIAFLTLGPIGNYTTKAIASLSQQGVDAAHYDMRFVKPIDEVMLHEVFGKFKHVITVEDGCIQGGMGSAILEFMGDNGYASRVKRLGIPDDIIEHGEQLELHRDCGFDPQGIANAVKAMTGQEQFA